MQVCLWHICTDMILHSKQIPKCFAENTNTQQHCSTTQARQSTGTRTPWGEREDENWGPSKITPAEARD